jgi:GT2 family glycosyltransferase/SAM-dependent methyltransferase
MSQVSLPAAVVRPIDLPRRPHPGVSVVLSFLNEERFLGEAIASVLAQSYTNWELLLVDDGSTDGSSEIARNAAARDPDRIRYLEHPGHANRGLSASRNLGLTEASAEVVAFLDGDDVWLPRKLEQQVELMRRFPQVGLVYGRAENWYSWTGQPGDREKDMVRDLGVALDAVLGPRELLERMLPRRAAAPWPSGLAVRREIALAVGGFETDFPGMYEDQVFVAKVNLAAPVYAADRLWHRYRQHATSMYAVARGSGTLPRWRVEYLNWLLAYLDERGLERARVGELAETELRRMSDVPRKSRLAGIRSTARRALRALVPSRLRPRLASRWRGEPYTPPPGSVDLGHLRRLTPLSRKWGKDRDGRPIDRHYIERFLQEHSADIRGRVLEVGDASYTRAFGGDRVEHSEVLHSVAGDPAATLVGDLVTGEGIPTAAFDCLILTQVLHVLEDPAAAARTIHRALRPGGVLLATFPGISQVSRWDMLRWGDYWRFTDLAVRRLFQPCFGSAAVHVRSHGNVLAAAAFLYGLSDRELRAEELDHVDPDYQLILTARVVRQEGR